ncbi:MAG TPA: T9SS type A sorting domain-containing protein [Bacteroidia bacterium]|nr:T9SS type A sorting domain-containing protein [Bacteroidia bacterium]
MKKIIFLLAFFAAASFSAEAQTSATLDTNIVAATLLDHACFFNSISDGGFIIPKNSSLTTLLFASDLWIGGLDASHHLHLAAETYAYQWSSYHDFGPGPIANNYTSTAYLSRYENVWKMDKSTVDYHKAHWSDPGYVVPPSIANWPGNGNAVNGEAHLLAPYFDYNGNGIYDPQNGDYPLIRGDQAVFFIWNDADSAHATGGLPLGIEIHAMFYEMACPIDSALLQTVFADFQIYNRSTNNYDSTYVGVFTDQDIGCSDDDYEGCDSTLNMYYAYNGEPIDQNCPSGDFPYGVHPPAEGTVFLNQKMSSFIFYNNDNLSNGNPDEPTDYYNYMQSKWKDSTHVTYGENGYQSSDTLCNYVFPGNPSDVSAWSETTNGDPYGDRRGIGATGPFTFPAGTEKTIDIAYVFGRDYTPSGNNLTSVTTLKQNVQQIINDYTNGSPCGGDLNTVKNYFSNPKNLTLFPNPATNALNVKTNFEAKDLTYQIYNVTGQEISEGNFDSGETNNIDISQLPSGMYMLIVHNTEGQFAKKFEKE